ncbi:hypothetical protein PoB_000646500 [Plakobranchus ocellatus]|uniref:Uncharacterized protein n=1 Tax=Plakobranchus ocellatus TaxID=259542 RepID=A0AAV3YBT8_9GAST|nr:hypothetical protein PoB_000646500 [Plakobranchus ocellatus]
MPYKWVYRLSTSIQPGVAAPRTLKSGPRRPSDGEIVWLQYKPRKRVAVSGRAVGTNAGHFDGRASNTNDACEHAIFKVVWLPVFRSISQVYKVLTIVEYV